MIMEKKYILVTSALPYVNNVLHIGNIAGSLLPADVYYRFKKMKDKNAIFISGADENGTPTEVEALEKNKKPEEVVDYYFKIQKRIIDWFYIEPNNYSETSKSEVHKQVVKELFLKAFINGYIIEKEEELPYDPKIDRFLADRYVIGKCPYCGYEKAKGDQCEACGRLLDPKELINPISIITKSPVEFRKTKHLYLDLSKFENEIDKYIESKKGIFTDLAYSTAKSWIKEGLKPRSITRDIRFGINVPYEDLWEITLNLIFNKLDFSSAEKLHYSLSQALKSLGLAFNEKDSEILMDVIQRNWPRIDNILKEYNYFRVYKDKVLYVWFDALIGYISFTIEKFKEFYKIEDLEKIDISDVKEKDSLIYINDTPYKVVYELKENYLYVKEIYPLDNNFEKIYKYIMKKHNVNSLYTEINWKKFWGDDGIIYHFLGKDNIPFHTVFWPAILLSVRLDDEKYERFKGYFKITGNFKFNLPYNVIGLSYLNYEGGKISKSNRWGVFCDSLIETNSNPEYWRFYLIYILPENKDTDFKWNEFKEVINKELVNNIGNLTHRVLSFAKRYYNGNVRGRIIDNIFRNALIIYQDCIINYDAGRLSQALRNILDLSNYGNKIFQENEPWKNPENNKDLIRTLISILILIYSLLYPILPRTSQQFFRYININVNSFDDALKYAYADEYIVSSYDKPLFIKIDHSHIEELRNVATSPRYSL